VSKDIGADPWRPLPEISPPLRFGPEGSGKIYEENAIIGGGDDGNVDFWSFTSDGKRSQGVIADVADLHPGATGRLLNFLSYVS